MRVIIAGSRTMQDMQVLLEAVSASGLEIDTVLSPGTTGVAALGEQWARQRGLPVEVYPADTLAGGKAAAARRNARMADVADALICLHTGTKGSWSIMQEMRLRGKPVHEVQL